MLIHHEGYVLPVTFRLAKSISKVIAKSGIHSKSGYRIQLRNILYPVFEYDTDVLIEIGENGKITCITLYETTGTKDYAHKTKYLEFNFSLGLYHKLRVDHPIHAATAVFPEWQSNFVSTLLGGHYRITVEAL